MLTLELLHRQVLVGLCIASLISTATAEDSQVKAWGSSAKKAYALCSFRMGNALLFRDQSHLTLTNDCVDFETRKLKASFGSALASAPPKVSGPMKDYFAVWFSSMQALKNLQTLSKSHAEQQDNAAETRLSELWTRVELEAGP